MITVALSLEAHKTQFEECVLPAVERHARVVFRNLRNREDEYAEAIADCIAHGWQGYVFALRRGKEPWLFPTVLATFAARKTSVGRKVGKPMKAKCVFSAARKGRVTLEPWEESLKENTDTPVPDQVAFRLDFPAWLKTLTPRNRGIALTFMAGDPAKHVANRFDLSPGRVTQIRQQMKDEWEVFTA